MRLRDDDTARVDSLGFQSDIEHSDVLPQGTHRNRHVAVAGVWAQSGGAAREQQSACSFLYHLIDHAPNGCDRAEQVIAQREHDILDIQFENRLQDIIADHRAVLQHVNPAEALADAFDGGGELGTVENIGRRTHGLDSRRLELPYIGVQFVRSSGNQPDSIAFAPEAPSHRHAEKRACPDHEQGFHVVHNRSPKVSSTTGLSRVPIPSMVTSTRSPALSQRCGLRHNPTPSGVPVAMMSPGSKVMMCDRNSMMAGTSKIILEVLLVCRISPPIFNCSSRFCGSGISSRVTNHGPIGAKPSKFLPAPHCEVRSWTSLAETSLKTE